VAEALAGLQQTNILDAVERASFEADLARDNIVEPTARPVYTYEYKVADDKAQTYISMAEERDGDNLSGSYSYVDANGGLVTVNFEAGVGGYTENRQVKDGYVTIRAKPVSSVIVDNSVEVSGQTESQDYAIVSSYSQDQSQELLISKILSTLQPLIATTVQDVISSSRSSSSSSSSSRSSSSLTSSSVSSEDSDTVSTFGTGVSVSVATPDFQFRI